MGSPGSDTIIAFGIPEDPDGAGDIYTWDISALAEGSYRITATITDGISHTVATAPGTVTIDRTAPTVGTSPRGGTFATSLTVTLAANEPATIYYTLDGSTPTVSSPQYSAPITVSQATTIRFMAVDRAGNASAVSSETYTQAAATQYWLFGCGYIKVPPKNYQGEFAFLATGPANPDGWLSYQCSKAKLQWVSTSITAVTVSGQSATISGRGKLNGASGYTFTATVKDASPDRFGISIYKPDGSLYYQAASSRLATGEVMIVPLEPNGWLRVSDAAK